MAVAVSVPELEDGVEEVLAVDRDPLKRRLERHHDRHASLPSRVKRGVFEACTRIRQWSLRQSVDCRARPGGRLRQVGGETPDLRRRSHRVAPACVASEPAGFEDRCPVGLVSVRIECNAAIEGRHVWIFRPGVRLR